MHRLILVVLDPVGAPVDGASIAITSAGAGPVLRSYTDADGTARFEGLLVGQQLLSVRGTPPLSRLAIDGLEVATGTPETLTVTLGDPLPRGFSVTGARTADDDLLVDRGTLGMSVPDAAGVDGISARLTLAEQAKLWTEPAAGCLVPAALRVLERVGPDARLGLVVCGGNITFADVAAWVTRFDATPFPPRVPARV